MSLAAGRKQKSEYVKPQLVKHGDVAELTRANLHKTHKDNRGAANHRS